MATLPPHRFRSDQHFEVSDGYKRLPKAWNFMDAHRDSSRFLLNSKSYQFQNKFYNVLYVDLPLVSHTVRWLSKQHQKFQGGWHGKPPMQGCHQILHSVKMGCHPAKDDSSVRRASDWELGTVLTKSSNIQHVQHVQETILHVHVQGFLYFTSLFLRNLDYETTYYQMADFVYSGAFITTCNITAHFHGSNACIGWS